MICINDLNILSLNVELPDLVKSCLNECVRLIHTARINKTDAQ